MEMEEGEEGSGDEPSAQQVLLNPLVWWKVHDFIPHLYHFNKLGFRYMLLNSLPSLGWPRTILPFLQLVSPLSKSSQNPETFVAIMQLSEREDDHNGPADEGLDTEWVILNDATKGASMEAWC